MNARALPSLMLLTAALSCKTPAPAGDTAASSASAAPSLTAPTPLLPPSLASTTSDDGPPNESTMVRMAREDRMPLDALLKTKSPTGALFRRVDKKADTGGYASLSEAERNVYLAFQTDAEVKIVGFADYFDNDHADHAEAAAASLDAVGAAPFAKLVRDALTVFPKGKPAPDKAGRRKQLKAISEGDRAKWSALDKEWKKLPDVSATYLDAYARTHRDGFKN